MNYKEIFAVTRKAQSSKLDQYGKLNSKEHKYELFDFESIIEELKLGDECRLEDKFYLDYFSFKLLFEIEPIEISDFISYYYSESDYQSELLQIFQFEILPLINEVLENMIVTVGNIYPGSNELTNGLYFKSHSKTIIYNPLFTKRYFFYRAASSNESSKLRTKSDSISKFIDQHEIVNPPLPKLKWVGQASHVGFLVRDLMEKGYIEKPIKDGKFNISKAAELILNTFQFNESENPQPATLKRSVNMNDKKYDKTSENFQTLKYNLPKADRF